MRQQDLKTVERDVENLRYVLTQPLTTVWKAINDLKVLSKAAQLPYSDAQLVDLALTIIKNTHDFETELSAWIRKPPVAQTYENMKTHFNDALDHL